MPTSKHCGHRCTTGEWLSSSHSVMCCGVPRDELDVAVRAGEIRTQTVGWGRHVELWRADVEKRWPGKVRAR